MTFFSKDLYQFIAQDIAPPFLLSTHTHTPLPLLKDIICESAIVYRSQHLHIVTDGQGDREIALQLLADNADDNDDLTEGSLLLIIHIMIRLSLLEGCIQ